MLTITLIALAAVGACVGTVLFLRNNKKTAEKVNQAIDIVSRN